MTGPPAETRRASDFAPVPARNQWRFRWMRHRYLRRVYLVALIPIYAVAALFVGLWIGANEVIREWWADWRLP